MITEEKMIGYLQSLMNAFKKDEKQFGFNDMETIRKFDAMIACKEMVESLIQKPVNLGQDGKVTVGF